MAEFYVEKTTNETGEHVMHSSTCSALPAADKLQYMGARSNAPASMKEAADWFTRVAPCPKCLAS